MTRSTTARRAAWLLGAFVALALPLTAHAQAAKAKAKPVRMSAVLSAFLADASGRTRGLPWTSGAGLPVRWDTPKPVANTIEPAFRGKGMTLTRAGTVLVAHDDGDPIEMSLRLYGNAAGIQRTQLIQSYQGNFDADPRARADSALAKDACELTALKCDRTTEGVTYGNVAYVLKAPGKTASALWQQWNCTGTGDCAVVFSILYRRADLAEVECATP